MLENLLRGEESHEVAQPRHITAAEIVLFPHLFLPPPPRTRLSSPASVFLFLESFRANLEIVKSDVKELLRGTTIHIRVLSEYIRLVGHEYLIAVVKPHVRLLTNVLNLEVLYHITSPTLNTQHNTQHATQHNTRNTRNTRDTNKKGDTQER